MTNFEMSISIVTAICLVGVIALIGFGKETAVLMPILTALIGWLIAKKEDVIVDRLPLGKKKKK